MGYPPNTFLFAYIGNRKDASVSSLETRSWPALWSTFLRTPACDSCIGSERFDITLRPHVPPNRYIRVYRIALMCWSDYSGVTAQPFYGL